MALGIWAAGSATGLAQQSGVGDWQIETGAAVFFAPDYEGSDDYEASPVPLLDITWRERVTLTTKGGPGLYVMPYRSEELTAEIGIRYEGGRDESDNDALRGLGDMDIGAVAVGALEYELGPLELGFELARDIGGDRDGLSATLEAGFDMPVLNNKGMFSVTPHITWVNEDYMDNSFGITSTQASRSNLNLAQYDPGSGFRDAGVTLGLGYQFAENWTGIARFDYSRLMSEAADSPLVDGQGSANQLSGAIGISYTW